jgi:hypothetical protein
MNSRLTEVYSHSIPISAKERQFLCSRRKLTNTDFWDFYVAHRVFIDSLIVIWSFNYSRNYDIEDIRQEVLYRLQINNILKQYDHTRSQLNTFLTLKIVNYIKHVIRYLPCMGNFIKNCKDFTCEEYDDRKYSVNEKLSKLKKKFGPEMVDLINKLQEGWNLNEIAEERELTHYCISSQYMRALKKTACRRMLNE